nr:MAG TPA: hypothetical protein [Caudoviricetes sp.]
MAITGLAQLENTACERSGLLPALILYVVKI